MNTCEPEYTVEKRPGFDNPAALGHSCGGDGVPRVGMAVIESAGAAPADERVVNLRSADRGAHREHAAGEALREAHQIGLHAGEVAGEHLATPSEAREDFVRNQQHTVLCAKPPHALQEFDWMHAHSASAPQQRLYAHSDYLALPFFPPPPPPLHHPPPPPPP